MPSTSASLTVMVSPAEAPDRIESLDDVASFFDDESLYCATESRGFALSGWLQKAISGYAMADLEYLVRNGEVLREAMLHRAIQAIDTLLKTIDADPITFLVKLGLKNPADYSYEPEASRLGDEKMVRAELSLSAALPEPQGHADDGDGWAYMVGFLKSHQAILKHARSHELCVLYGQ